MTVKYLPQNTTVAIRKDQDSKYEGIEVHLSGPSVSNGTKEQNALFLLGIITNIFTNHGPGKANLLSVTLTRMHVTVCM